MTNAYIMQAEIVAGYAAPVKTTFEGAKEETEVVLATCIEKLLASTNIKPHEVCTHGEI